MKISVMDAKGQSTEFVRPAEPAVDRPSRSALIAAVQESARTKLVAGPDAARSQNFLYDAEGLAE